MQFLFHLQKKKNQPTTATVFLCYNVCFLDLFYLVYSRNQQKFYQYKSSSNCRCLPKVGETDIFINFIFPPNKIDE